MTSQPDKSFREGEFRSKRNELAFLRDYQASRGLDTALKILQLHGIEFFKETIPGAACCLAAIAYIQNVVLPGIFSTRNASDFSLQIQEFSLSILTAIVVGGSLFFMGATYVMTVVTSAVANHFSGKVVRPTDAPQRIARTFLAQLTSLLIALSPVLISLGIFIASAIVANQTAAYDFWSTGLSWLGVISLIASVPLFFTLLNRLALSGISVLLEGKGLRGSLTRSRNLLQAERRQIQNFVSPGQYLFLLFILSLLLIGGFQLGLMGIQAIMPIGQIVSSLPGGQLLSIVLDLLPSLFVLWLLIVVWSILMTVTFFQRRVHKEGYDIELMTTEIAHAHKGRFDL